MNKLENIETIIPESWLDLQNILFEDKNEEIGRYRSGYAYRGVANSQYGLETSIQRNGRKPSDIEGNLIRTFQKYAPINTLIDDYNNFWNWISLGQHHGLPTGLLDWTFSPNVALHFLTEFIPSYDKEGVVWMVDFLEMRNFLPQTLTDRLEQKKYSLSRLKI